MKTEIKELATTTSISNLPPYTVCVQNGHIGIIDSYNGLFKFIHAEDPDKIINLEPETQVTLIKKLTAEV